VFVVVVVDRCKSGRSQCLRDVLNVVVVVVVVVDRCKSGRNQCHRDVLNVVVVVVVVDRCKSGRSQCHRDAHCFNTTKSHRCKCKEGYYGNGKICVGK